MRIGMAFGVVSFGFLAVAWAWRSPQPVLRGEAGPVPLPPPQVEERVASGEPQAEEFWSSIHAERMGRDGVLRATEDFLGMTPGEAGDFRATALSAVEEVDRAWATREAGWLDVSSSAASDPELLGRLEAEIQSRYVSEKDRQLQRVAALLGGGERRDLLRERLEEWFDALR